MAEQRGNCRAEPARYRAAVSGDFYGEGVVAIGKPAGASVGSGGHTVRGAHGSSHFARGTGTADRYHNFYREPAAESVGGSGYRERAAGECPGDQPERSDGRLQGRIGLTDCHNAGSIPQSFVGKATCVLFSVSVPLPY